MCTVNQHTLCAINFHIHLIFAQNLIIANYFCVCIYIAIGVKMPILLVSNTQNLQKANFL